MSESDDLAIPRVSPTSAEDLLKCRARALRKGHGSGYVETPTLALGNASHALSERVYNGEFDILEPSAVRQSLVTAFDADVAQRHARMLESAGKRHVPLPRRWRNYRAIRSRLPRFLESQVALRRTGNAPESLAVEELIESRDGIIYGYPDRVEKEGDVVRIVDLKSGLTHSDGIPDAYRRQLMVYAYLWHEKTGAWPDEAAIQRVTGRFEGIDINPDQILGLVDTIRSRREEANALLQSGGEATELAEPSPGACKWCRRRPYCAPFTESIDESFELGGPCLTGTVTDIIAGDQSHGFEVEVMSSNLGPDARSLRVIGADASAMPMIGDQIAVMDARSTSKPGLISLNAWSTLATTG